eukprot:1713301-Amphidinium_carterae.1
MATELKRVREELRSKSWKAAAGREDGSNALRSLSPTSVSGKRSFQETKESVNVGITPLAPKVPENNKKQKGANGFKLQLPSRIRF